MVNGRGDLAKREEQQDKLAMYQCLYKYGEKVVSYLCGQLSDACFVDDGGRFVSELNNQLCAFR